MRPLIQGGLFIVLFQLFVMVSLSAIYIYPIKSFPGLSLEKAMIEDEGIQYDRRWMLVDAHGMAITQRKNPELASFKMSQESNGFLVISPDGKSILIPFDALSESSMEVQVWDDKMVAAMVGESFDAFFTECLGFQTHLVKVTHEMNRVVDSAYNQGNDVVSFADGFPHLLISEESLEDLNSRLEKPVSMSRFRPNLVVKGAGDGFAEDTWKKMLIGKVSFLIMKPCARCIMTTVDPATSVKDINGEPLKTLSKYRKKDGKVFFGQNLLHTTKGEISLVDNVVIE